jgi:hypothetical protein
VGDGDDAGGDTAGSPVDSSFEPLQPARTVSAAAVRLAAKSRRPADWPGVVLVEFSINMDSFRQGDEARTGRIAMSRLSALAERGTWRRSANPCTA